MSDMDMATEYEFFCFLHDDNNIVVKLFLFQLWVNSRADWALEP